MIVPERPEGDPVFVGNANWDHNFSKEFAGYCSECKWEIEKCLCCDPPLLKCAQGDRICDEGEMERTGIQELNPEKRNAPLINFRGTVEASGRK